MMNKQAGCKVSQSFMTKLLRAPKLQAQDHFVYSVTILKSGYRCKR